MVRIVIVAVIAWIAGVATYFAALLLLYGEPFAWNGDAKAVLFWSGCAFAVSFFVLYLPLLHGLRRILGGVAPAWPFPAATAALGTVPTALIAVLNGGNARSMLSDEAVLFYLMFAATGLVVGLGFVVVERNASAMSRGEA